jgi:TolB-like protein
VRIALALMILSMPAAATEKNVLAVMPFKNLNSDPQLEWLRLGIAETMIADLRNAKQSVVERDQLDRALAEIALQGGSLTDESRAAQAGKLVGASGVVVGGYQKAGGQLRITARMVTVETGVVIDTAKVTGDVENVFALQDEVVTKLLKLPDVKKRPKPKQPKKTLQAYEAYAKSLAISSDADKIVELRRALDLDPDFHYALYDLRALESRLNRYAKKGKEIVDERTAEQLAKVNDDKLSLDDRNTAAMQAMSAFLTQYRYAAMLDVATQIYDSDLKPGTYINARELAAYYIFLALLQLKKTDLAFQAGERYLQQWPAGAYAQGIDLQMRAAIEQRHRHDEAVKRAPKELEELEFDERDRERKGQLSATLARNFAFRRCSILVSSERWEEGIDACNAFINAYKDADDGDHLVKLSRFLLSRCHAERGDFKNANDEALRLLDEHPVWAREHSVEVIRRTWPQP